MKFARPVHIKYNLVFALKFLNFSLLSLTHSVQSHPSSACIFTSSSPNITSLVVKCQHIPAPETRLSFSYHTATW